MMTDYLGIMKEKIIQQRTEFKDALVRQLKSEVPSMKVPAELKEWAVENLGWEDLGDLVNEFGKDAVNKLLFETYKSKFDKRRTK